MPAFLLALDAPRWWCPWPRSSAWPCGSTNSELSIGSPEVLGPSGFGETASGVTVAGWWWEKPGFALGMVLLEASALGLP